MKMKDKWFERGGFLYDITKEYGRLRKKDIKDIIDNPNNNKSDLDFYEILFLNNLDNVAKNFITRRIPKNVNSVSIFHTCFNWKSQNNNEKKLPIIDELKSFANTNFIYKLPGDWDTDRLLRYSFRWDAAPNYWPHVEQLRYSICEIKKNYPQYNYNNWNAVATKSSSAEKWILKGNNKDTSMEIELSSDICTGKSIVADISIIPSMTKNIGPKKLKEYISDNVNKFYYLEPFLNVMYTCGNMTTIPNIKGSNKGGGNDRWDAKLQNIKDFIVEGKGKKIGITLYEIYNKKNEPWKQYVIEHYMNDYVNKDWNVKNIQSPEVVLQKDEEPSARGNEETFYINAAKLIIQRGYRIYYQYERDNEGKIKYKDDKPVRNKDLFNEDLSFICKAKDELQEAFKAVGIPENKLDIIE